MHDDQVGVERIYIYTRHIHAADAAFCQIECFSAWRGYTRELFADAAGTAATNEERTLLAPC